MKKTKKDKVDKVKKRNKPKGNLLNILTIIILISLITLVILNNNSKKIAPINITYNSTCPEITYEEKYTRELNKAIENNNFRLCDKLKSVVGPNNLNPTIECYYGFAAEKRRAEICSLPESKEYTIKGGILLKDGETYTQSDAYGPDKCYLLVVEKNAPYADFTKNQTKAVCNRIISPQDKENCLDYIDIFEKE